MAASTTSKHSAGTLLHCEPAGECQWVGTGGRVVLAAELRAQLLADHVSEQTDDDAARTLTEHMEHIEQVHRHAQRIGHTFPFAMGVSARHLATDMPPQQRMLPEAFVVREAANWRTHVAARRLATTNASATATAAAELNWCSTDNPHGRSVCSSVKSQKKCGSCWAFAATDAIEAAVALASNQTAAVALAPQQFLSCSRRMTEQTFTYCWAAGGVASAPWLSDTMTWKSSNNGCAGGMTHGAFLDAAQLRLALVTELALPYDDADAHANASTAAAAASVCVPSRMNDSSAASITDYKQAIGKDCSTTHDASALLRQALLHQPIAVAVNSAYPFADYKGGLYACPHSGDLASKSDVNHALVLVGYGVDAVHGDYWLLKNSYGSAWGDDGFMQLLADNKTNCGLNIFPVVPVGAVAGTAAPLAVDGGGAARFVGLALSVWVALAVVVGCVTVVLLVVGVWWSKRQRVAIRKQTSGWSASGVYVAHNR